MSSETRASRGWLIAVIILLAIIIIGGIAIWSGYEPAVPVDIDRQPDKRWDGTVYIGGAVNLPGYYPFSYEDSIGTLILAAGGTVNETGIEGVTLVLNDAGEEYRPQKIDINRAEKWLLEALPGIGATLAQRIIDYRTEKGRFDTALELLEVNGIGKSIYENIKEYITVSD